MDAIVNAFGTPEVDEFAAQLGASERLAPGDEGWWKVWGASVQDLQDDDIVVGTDPDGNTEAYLVTLVKHNGIRCSFNVGSISGARQSIGMLAPILVFRRGSKNTLSPHV